MITCHLTKLELALDQLRKTNPKLKPADAALLTSALVLTGRHALAQYDGESFAWPEEVDKLSRAMLPEVEQIQEGAETTKKAKAASEEEPTIMNVALVPNLSAGEKLLEGRNDLKTKLSDMLDEGVEFIYSQTDVGWQWALDHVNWATVSGAELDRKVKVRCQFTGTAVGVEMGAAGAKKRKASPKAAAAAAAAAEAAEAEAETDALADVPSED